MKRSSLSLLALLTIAACSSSPNSSTIADAAFNQQTSADTAPPPVPFDSSPPVELDGGGWINPIDGGIDHFSESPEASTAPEEIKHRPAEVACTVSTGPRGQNPGDKSDTACTSDADCNGPIPYGQGHCQTIDGKKQCSYDGCLRDADCGEQGVCSCHGATSGYAAISPGNVCVLSNCRTDAECPESGLCSPSYAFSGGPFYGVRGYYCHTKKDKCRTTQDCAGNGFCAYDPEAAVWACSTMASAG